MSSGFWKNLFTTEYHLGPQRPKAGPTGLQARARGNVRELKRSVGQERSNTDQPSKSYDILGLVDCSFICGLASTDERIAMLVTNEGAEILGP